MRGLITTTLVAAGLAGRVASQRDFIEPPQLYAEDEYAVEDVEAGPRRKTLGFGPVHPHAVFRTDPHFVSASLLPVANGHVDPFEVAEAFVSDLLKEESVTGSTFAIRKDSYTDKSTGVSHIYVRQLVNGLEVADGDININIKDGRVISYGNSFFKGPIPLPFTSPADSLAEPHVEFCEELLGHMESDFEQVQAAFDAQLPVEMEEELVDEKLSTKAEIYSHNCLDTDLPNSIHESRGKSSGEIGNPRDALLQFMMAATPSSEVQVDIQEKYDEHIAGMTSYTETHFVGSHENMVEYIGNVPDTVNPVKTKLAYIQVPTKDGTTALSLVWKFEVEMKDNWYEASVNAIAPHRIVSVVDWASDSPMPTPLKKKTKETGTYNVFAWGINDPSEGNRTIVKEKYDALASPMGWHSLPYTLDPASRGVRSKDEFWRNTTTTWGNNVFAHENWEGRNSWEDNYRPDAGSSLSFNYTYDPKPTNKTDSMDEAKKYINTTITQLFYTSNMAHDLFYRYGFDEPSGNFQQYNFGRGGAEGDAVIANAQDGSGFNNANFMTPPDGQNGRCRMYLWNTASPYRDGDLEAGIVIHELAHGLSTRLTGGPANSGCLGWGESGGMGEGWGDFLATTIRSGKEVQDWPMGAWAANREGGIRNFVYSLNETVNPSTYKTLDKPGYWGVHAIGEVWAEILWVVSQRLIAKHGFVDDLFPPTPLENGTIPEGNFYRPREFTAAGKEKPLVPIHGNSLTVQLVLNGMKLQACRPSFFDARDAIIQADQILTGGENYCELWAGFSSRGLGPDARVEGRTPWGGGVRTNDYEIPLTCKVDKE